MNHETLQDLFAELSAQPYLTSKQIPQLSLYIDQILTLFSAGTKEEQALTKSMVNNYSKEKMLRPIKGKKYSREQILQILMICRMKSVLSMDQIKTVTTSLMEEENCEESLESILCLADCQRGLTAEFAVVLAEKLDVSDDAALVLQLCQLSDFFAQAARNVVDYSFHKE